MNSITIDKTTKKNRQRQLQAVVKQLDWQLPNRNLDSCWQSLVLTNNGSRIVLKRFQNKGCGCFSGIEVVVRPKNQDEYSVTVIEAKPFNGYRQFNNWLKAQLKRLTAELAEEIEQENFAQLQALLVPQEKVGGTNGK